MTVPILVIWPFFARLIVNDGKTFEQFSIVIIATMALLALRPLCWYDPGIIYGITRILLAITFISGLFGGIIPAR
jgi:hypothetical protein